MALQDFHRLTIHHPTDYNSALRDHLEEINKNSFTAYRVAVVTLKNCKVETQNAALQNTKINMRRVTV